MCGHGPLPMRWRSPPPMTWRAAPGSVASMRRVFCRRWRSGTCRCGWRWPPPRRRRNRDWHAWSVRAIRFTFWRSQRCMRRMKPCVCCCERGSSSHHRQLIPHEPLQARHRPWWVSQRGRGLHKQSGGGFRERPSRREALEGFQASRFAPAGLLTTPALGLGIRLSSSHRTLRSLLR